MDQHGESMSHNSAASASPESKPSRTVQAVRHFPGISAGVLWLMGPKQSRAARAVRGVFGGTLATLVALVAYVVIGVITGPLVVGLPGLLVCAALGAATGAGLRGLGSPGARITSGFLGGLVASYFIQAFVEACPWGTLDWAVKGGAVAAAFSLPVAIVTAALIELGLIVLSRSSRRD